MVYRVIRIFGPGITPSTDKAYRVETSELMTQKSALALMESLNGKEDWTAEEDISNRSETYRKLSKVVERIIRNSSHDLIAGRADLIGMLIMAKLAHEYGITITSKTLETLDKDN